ncbi:MULTISPECIES: SDR family NAD(P)-dependent oxidoreductase [Agrobacterium]|uniref:Short-chain dehydrogenase n=1 Tax=Agrobacterium tumefaciens TaxID=358 RepID=A0A176XH96_AGRTU|nr:MULTISPECIES: glucose 1-dehydrogenase [Agrobacterium]OAE49254.1 short-chain dehydrogenase [Agrobacterium tumefaciens]
MKKLEGKVAIVTGGNSGIGKETAKLFAANGAQVIVTARRQDALDAAVLDIGHGAIGIRGDVADLEHHKSVASEAKRLFGGVDIYVANAAVIDLKPSNEVTPAEFDHHFAINTRGVFFGVQTIVPSMHDGGSILLTSSLAATKVLDNHAVYAGTKAAMSAFARNWVKEFKSRKIRVNVISPGPVDTEILAKLGVSERERPAFLEAMANMIPVGRLGQPMEIANAALFLVSPEASFVNGVELHVDGGMSIA